MICKLRHTQCYWSLHYYFILFIRPMCSRIFKKNVCIMVHSRNIDIFLIDPISSCRLIISVLDAFQDDMRYGFKLLTFHADQDAKGFRLSVSRVTKREQSRHYPRLILLLHQDTVRSSWMLRKYHETSVIVLCLERM